MQDRQLTPLDTLFYLVVRYRLILSYSISFECGGDTDTDDAVFPPELNADMSMEELQQETSCFFSVLRCFTVYNPHAI